MSTPPPKRLLTTTLPLAQFYQDYILSDGRSLPKGFSAIIRGCCIHSVECNTLWDQLYRVLVRDGNELVKLVCTQDEPVTVFFKE